MKKVTYKVTRVPYNRTKKMEENYEKIRDVEPITPVERMVKKRVMEYKSYRRIGEEIGLSRQNVMQVVRNMSLRYDEKMVK